MVTRPHLRTRRLHFVEERQIATICNSELIDPSTLQIRQAIGSALAEVETLSDAPRGLRSLLHVIQVLPHPLVEVPRLSDVGDSSIKHGERIAPRIGGYSPYVEVLKKRRSSQPMALDSQRASHLDLVLVSLRDRCAELVRQSPDPGPIHARSSPSRLPEFRSHCDLVARVKMLSRFLQALAECVLGVVVAIARKSAKDGREDREEETRCRCSCTRSSWSQDRWLSEDGLCPPLWPRRALREERRRNSLSTARQ